MRRNVVLVCGGRDFTNRQRVFKALDIVHDELPITKLVQGYADGADMLAHEWAMENNVPSTGSLYFITPKMWKEQGKRAGYIRNKHMRDKEKPDLVVAFPGGNGTKMMVELANEKDIPVIIVPPDGVN